MSGTALSQDTYLNAGTPLSVIGGGGGGGGISTVTGLAPNIITGTVAGAVTVGLTSSIAGISSIAFGGAYGSITGVSTINGVPATGANPDPLFSTITMNNDNGISKINNASWLDGLSKMDGTNVEFNLNSLPNTATDPNASIVYADSTMNLLLRIDEAAGVGTEANVELSLSTVVLGAAYIDGPASASCYAEFTPSVITIGGYEAEVATNFTSTTVTMEALNVSSINGVTPTTLNTLDIAAAAGDLFLPANVRGSVNLALNTPLTAGHRYVYSPTVYISSSGAGAWPANAAGTCWLSGQTSEILGGPWSYSQLSTAKGNLNVSVVVPTSMFGTAGVSSFSPNFSVSADWPMNTVIAVSSIQTTNPDFYATTLVDLGTVSSGP